MLDGVATFTATGSAQFAASDTGTMAYLPGQSTILDNSIYWMDRDGKTTQLRTASAAWSNPHFAPDGHRLALEIDDGMSQQVDVWIYEWARDTLTRLTFDPAPDYTPVWTPDGRRIVFTSPRAGGAPNLYWQRADGTGEAQRLTESKNLHTAASWHPSGKFLAFDEQTPQTQNDLMILPMNGDEASGWKPGSPTVFLKSPFSERWPMFSPDGRWLAYISNESGRNEVYVTPVSWPWRQVAGVNGGWHISDLVAHAARVVLRGHRQSDHGDHVHGGRRLVSDG